ncbi:hypothetical protein BHE74_00054292 [Ensete ventricosum]|nr:hypothetical protein BHE74_00054292 [Ensete ventricosum]
MALAWRADDNSGGYDSGDEALEIKRRCRVWLEGNSGGGKGRSRAAGGVGCKRLMRVAAATAEDGGSSVGCRGVEEQGRGRKRRETATAALSCSSRMGRDCRLQPLSPFFLVIAAVKLMRNCSEQGCLDDGGTGRLLLRQRVCARWLQDLGGVAGRLAVESQQERRGSLL